MHLFTQSTIPELVYTHEVVKVPFVTHVVTRSLCLYNLQRSSEVLALCKPLTTATQFSGGYISVVTRLLSHHHIPSDTNVRGSLCSFIFKKAFSC